MDVFKSISISLTDFAELNPVAPLQMLLEVVTKKEKRPLKNYVTQRFTKGLKVPLSLPCYMANPFTRRDKMFWLFLRYAIWDRSRIVKYL